MNDADWSRDLAKKFQSWETERSLRDAVFVERQRIRKEYTSSLMADLKSEVARKVKLINSEVQKMLLSVVDAPGTSNFLIRRNDPPSRVKQISVQCNTDRCVLTISVFGQTPGTIRELFVSVDESTGRGYLADNENPETVDRVAKTTIEMLLGRG